MLDTLELSNEEIENVTHQRIVGLMENMHDTNKQQNFLNNYLPWLMKCNRWKSIIIERFLKQSQY